MKDRRKPILKKQPPPFTIKVELTEGCNLYCKFCGIRGIRTGPGNFKFMEVKTAARIAQGIQRNGWSSKIEFTMRGEPLMNPDYMQIFRIFRQYLPETPMSVFTNGGPLVKHCTEKIDKLLNIINVLALDDYEYAGFVRQIKKKYKGKHQFKIYPDEPVYKKRKSKEHVMVIVPDIGKGKVSTRHLNNMCMTAGPPDYSCINKICALPFREMVIRWNGKVDLCCQDWRMLYIIGNIWFEPINEIWNDGRMWAARNKLFHKQRDFAPCFGCNKISYRIGLLPDVMAQYTCKFPSKLDERVIKRVLKVGPQTEVVKRPWERDNNKLFNIKEM